MTECFLELIEMTKTRFFCQVEHDDLVFLSFFMIEDDDDEDNKKFNNLQMRIEQISGDFHVDLWLSD